ncbi:hypothetical protein [Microseira wollei]|uniref:Secreted protein n=1 Tax=Microseira wollei NIES-4236 TaxID=2530354 RepID=A0AAV3XEQ9_9CYAN|nr:hypothetical protein [Microseira wollei]GET39916.1 hypothetical protein MiSe_46880 [Microseira wollei NIES-4236]
MNKIKLLLLACSWILGAMLILAHPAHAAIRLTARCAIARPLTVQLLSTPAIQTIPVSFGKKHGENSPAMLTAKDEINSIHQSGCGCATCQNGFEQLQGRFPQPNF